MSNILLSDTLSHVNQLGEMAGIDSDILNLIINPERITSVSIPVKMDDGSVKTFLGHRVRQSTILGPAKGGIRFHPAADVHTIRALSLLMAIKNSLVGLPFGGGKGGVEVDPSSLSKAELERLSRGYIRSIHDVIGPRIDVPATDVGTTSATIGVMLDEYEKIKGHSCPAVFTSKPVDLLGSLFRKEATGYGVHVITDMVVRKMGKSPEDTRIIIQGFGNVGLHLAKFLHQKGYKIVGLSDVHGAIYNEKGFDILKIIENLFDKFKEGYSLSDPHVSSFVSGTKVVDNKEILTLAADILIPAAIDDVITEKNVRKINAPCIIEAANAPISNEADDFLHKSGIQVVPDVLVNAGGVVVSYFEWVQNLQGAKWVSDKVKDRLVKVLSDAMNEVYEAQAHDDHKNISLRSVAYFLALRRIAASIRSRYSI